MGLADIRSVRQQAIEKPLGENARATVAGVADELGRAVIGEVAGQGVVTEKIKAYVRAHIRYAGTDTALIVEAGTCSFPSPLVEERRVGGRASRTADVERRTSASLRVRDAARPQPPTPPPTRGRGRHSSSLSAI